MLYAGCLLFLRPASKQTAREMEGKVSERCYFTAVTGIHGNTYYWHPVKEMSFTGHCVNKTKYRRKCVYSNKHNLQKIVKQM